MVSQSFNDSLHCPSSPRVKTMDQHFLDVPVHFHDSCELLYFEEGFGTRIVGDHTDDFTSGDMVLIGPNLPHTWQTNSIFHQGRHKIKSYVIYFKQDFLQEISSQTPDHVRISDFLERSLRGISFHGHTRRQVTGKLKQIAIEEGLRKIILFLEIIELLIQSEEYNLILDAAYKNTQVHKNTGRFNEIHSYILSNFRKEITLNDVASVANMTPKAFCRYFKNHTGKSLIRFIKELRVGHACRLLQKEEYSISQVCFDSGYNNMSHFNTTFKQITRQTPSGYRKALTGL